MYLLEERITQINKKLTQLKGKKNVMIWGTAENTLHLFQYTDISKYPIKGFTDNQKAGTRFFEKTVLAPGDVAWSEVDAVVISSFYHENEIEEELHKKHAFFGMLIKLNEIGQEVPFYQHLSEADISTFSHKNRDAVLYYDNLCLLLKIREAECPEVFRYFFEKNGFEGIEQIVVIGSNDFFLRLAETIAEDKKMSVTLICDINKKNEFPLNKLHYCFEIMYLDLDSCESKRLLNNAVILSDKNQVGNHAMDYFNTSLLLNMVSDGDWVTKAVLDKVRNYFKSKNINVLYMQVPSIEKLFPEGIRADFADLNADEIENMFGGGQGENYYLELKKCIIQTPPPLRKGKRLEFSDYRSPLINRIHGERVIINSPVDYDYTVWILGRCTADGTHTDDMHTIGKVLQDMFLNSDKLGSVPKVRAVGMPAVEFNVAINNWYALDIKKGDTVVILSPDRFLYGWEISPEREFQDAGEYVCYGDYEHCNHKGNQIYAECIYKFLTDDSRPESLNNFYGRMLKTGIPGRLLNDEIIGEDDLSGSVFDGNRELLQYKDELMKFRQTLSADSKIGSIVMNCNPFTLGHLYLIETALRQVDWLYIFVVEEDKSTFDFEDRMKLVKEGTKDMGRITIIPSGKFIISAITFPHYFTKDASPDVKVDTSMDAEVFAQHIAPVLDISLRFVGEEPTDNVTRQYNEMLARVLPRYGIDVRIIPRKVNEEGLIISASKVREAYIARNWKLINAMVPECTAEFLKSDFKMCNFERG